MAITAHPAALAALAPPPPGSTRTAGASKVGPWRRAAAAGKSTPLGGVLPPGQSGPTPARPLKNSRRATPSPPAPPWLTIAARARSARTTRTARYGNPPLSRAVPGPRRSGRRLGPEPPPAGPRTSAPPQRGSCAPATPAWPARQRPARPPHELRTVRREDSFNEKTGYAHRSTSTTSPEGKSSPGGEWSVKSSRACGQIRARTSVPATAGLEGPARRGSVPDPSPHMRGLR